MNKLSRDQLLRYMRSKRDPAIRRGSQSRWVFETYSTASRGWIRADVTSEVRQLLREGALSSWTKGEGEGAVEYAYLAEEGRS